MQPDINSMLGNANPSEEATKENPLDKLNEASKDASKKPKDSTKSVESFDDETFKQILMAGDNSQGLFTPEEKEDKDNPKHSEVDKEVEIKQGKVGKPQGKYAAKFLKDISKNPQNYKVQTPKGEMTISEAMKKGYNPITKRFDKTKSSEEIKKKHMEGLNDADKAKLEELTSPSAAHIAPKDAQAMGLPGDSPMIDGGTPSPQAGQPMAAPAAQPAQPAMTSGESTPEAGLDINSMLGGIQ